MIKNVPINNFTRPESIVTTGNNMFITFTASKKIKTELFLEITAGLQKAADLNVTDSMVADNNGREWACGCLLAWAGRPCRPFARASEAVGLLEASSHWVVVRAVEVARVAQLGPEAFLGHLDPVHPVRAH